MVGLVVLDIHLSAMLSNPVVSLVFVVGEGCRGRMLAKSTCSSEPSRPGPNDENVVNVH